MNRYQEIKCRKLDRTMTAGKCLRLQEEAEGFYGKDKAARCGSCPCEQGLEIRREIEMAQNKRRECRNCKRVMVIAQDGLCGGCWCRTKGLTGAAYDEALAKAKADFGGVPEGERAPQRKFYRGPQVKPQAADAEYAKPAEIVEPHPGPIEKPPEDVEATPTPGWKWQGPYSNHNRFWGLPGDLWLIAGEEMPAILVPFHDEDCRVYDALIKLSLKYRRDPYQQILWLLEKELLNERLLDDDPHRRDNLDAEATVTIAAREAGNAG